MLRLQQIAGHINSSTSSTNGRVASIGSCEASNLTHAIVSAAHITNDVSSEARGKHII
jgi:hypothetical protein